MADEPTSLGATALRAAIAQGQLSVRETVTACLARIDAVDRHGPQLRAVIETNPAALDIATALDGVKGSERGPLHGVPVLVKANVDTGDGMATSAGSLALAEHHAAADAGVVAHLRAAGAVVLGKTNLSEWANFRSTQSISGWSSLGGQTCNPYALDRNPCGSSSGSAVAVAAQLAPLAVGSETDGSIVCPAGVNGVVGIKPTIGLVSQHGIVPIAASQDTAGPMAATVDGAALLLRVMAEPNARPHLSLPGDGTSRPPPRIGVLRDYDGAASHPEVEAAFEGAIRQLQEMGAVCVDPIIAAIPDDVRRASFDLLLQEFKDGLHRYLANHGTGFSSIAQLIDYNTAHADTVMPLFGQEIFEAARHAAAVGSDENVETRRRSVLAMRGIVAKVFDEHSLDALVAPTNGPAWPLEQARGHHIGSSSIAAVSGWPSVAVPAALVEHLPVAVAFVGRPRHEASLIAVAARFEAVRGPFPAPRYLPRVE